MLNYSKWDMMAPYLGQEALLGTWELLQNLLKDFLYYFIYVYFIQCKK